MIFQGGGPDPLSPSLDLLMKLKYNGSTSVEIWIDFIVIVKCNFHTVGRYVISNLFPDHIN